LGNLLAQVVVTPTSLTLHLNRATLLSIVGLAGGEVGGVPITLETETRFKRNGRGLRYVLPGPEGSWGKAHQDRPLIQAVARGRVWQDQLLSGRAKSREEIAEANRVSGQHVARLLPLAWLAPDIVEAILEGRQPIALTVKRLLENCPWIGPNNDGFWASILRPEAPEFLAIHLLPGHQRYSGKDRYFLGETNLLHVDPQALGAAPHVRLL
jgi:hypothetical protein